MNAQLKTAQHTPGPWRISTGDYGIYRIFATVDKMPFYLARDVALGADAHLIAAAPELAAALRAVILFYRAPVWTSEMAALWKEITGSDEATTKVLCDTVRAALAKAGL